MIIAGAKPVRPAPILYIGFMLRELTALYPHLGPWTGVSYDVYPNGTWIAGVAYGGYIIAKKPSIRYRIKITLADLDQYTIQSFLASGPELITLCEPHSARDLSSLFAQFIPEHTTIVNNLQEVFPSTT